MYAELIKALRNMSKMGTKYGMAVVKMREAADAIELLQKTQQPKWIPVTERLPKMSILIKGMEMPPTCRYCAFRHLSISGNAFCTAANETIDYMVERTKRLDNCPLVELPPHGQLTKRLVYRGEVYNALEAERVNSLDGILTDPYKDGFHDGLKRALQILANEVEDAPTIIESEGEE